MEDNNFWTSIVGGLVFVGVGLVLVAIIGSLSTLFSFKWLGEAIRRPKYHTGDLFVTGNGELGAITKTTYSSQYKSFLYVFNVDHLDRYDSYSITEYNIHNCGWVKIGQL